MSGLAFEALSLGDRVRIVNPRGDIGLITLWTPQRAVVRKLEAELPQALEADSRIAVIANLYGDGMFAMLCNVLHNPQIRHLVALGDDLGLGVPGELAAFLERGVERTAVLGEPVLRVPGTARHFPPAEGFDADRLRRQVTFGYLGKLKAGVPGPLAAALSELPAPGPLGPDRVTVRSPEPDAGDTRRRPSDPLAHQVTRARPLDCWAELVVRTVRFGVPVTLAKGARLELLNTKVVIADPSEESEEALEEAGFSLDRFRAYAAAMLDPALPEDIAYTYGHRLRGHYERGGAPLDTLEAAAAELRADPQSRKAYISLWDTEADLADGAGGNTPGSPCLATVFFRQSAGKLTLTATYRAHNLLTAWLQNVYGLMAIQRLVAERAGIEPGPITVISHSLSIDPASTRLAAARALERRWNRDDDHDRDSDKYALREDPNGYFIVGVDAEAGELVAEHRMGGLLIGRYRGSRADDVAKQIAADMGVSLVSHALWLGSELQRHEQRLPSRPSPTPVTPDADRDAIPGAER